MFQRFVGGIKRYLRHPLSHEDCRRIVAQAEAGRDDNFLLLLRRAIYDRPQSPYRRLLDHARVEYEDVERDVRTHGVESAAARLCSAGVFVGYDEFKGKRRIERPGLSLTVQAEDFDNPLLTRDFEVASSGSTGARRRMAIDLELLVYESAVRRLFYEQAGVLNRPQAIWRPMPPGSSGIKLALSAAKLGHPLEHWFSTSPWEWSGGMWPSALLTAITVGAGRLAGGVVPKPEYVPMDNPEPVARWMAQCVQEGRPPLVSASTSSAVRIASVGLDLEGAVFELGGEPLTRAKLDVIESSGASILNFYALCETGPLGIGCLQPGEIDEVHLIPSKVAVTQREITNPDGLPLNSMLLTTLHPSTPKLLLNVDIGDYGVLSTGSCGCGLERSGFKQRLHTIRSYEKLTAGGMHFTDGDVLSVLEVILPQRHGGTPGDYQFVEQERQGLSCIDIVVSPRVQLRDANQVAATVLQHLSAQSRGAKSMAGQWQQSKTLELVRREPYVTDTGKTPPIRVMQG